MPVETAYVGIGSNLGDSVSIVREALKQLGQLAGCSLTAQSPLYRSEPVSDIPQGDYINAVAELSTELQPKALLIELQAIEQAFYRERDPARHWAPRTLDLDIVLFGQRIIDEPDLTVPHREMQYRLFVLVPLFDIIGDKNLPALGRLQLLIDRAPKIALARIDN